jgi:hypothetical protein
VFTDSFDPLYAEAVTPGQEYVSPDIGIETDLGSEDIAPGVYDSIYVGTPETDPGSQDIAPGEMYASADIGTGRAKDLGPISSASTDYAAANIDFPNQHMVSHFNQNIAPTLAMGESDPSDGDVEVKVDPFSKLYGDRTGLLIGTEDFKAGVYFNPLTEDPAMFAVEAAWK